MSQESVPATPGPADPGETPAAIDTNPTSAISVGRVDALDGIRTIAVGLVALFHVSMPGLKGGFIGVDVFFVLSGFLITTLLLTETLRKDRPDLGRFWSRRVMRLMPAAILVILVVLAWAALVAPVFRVPALSADATWSLLYVGNWRFISAANYFADDGTSSPLVHVWSLAVEEQFYVGWPLVVTGLALLARRGRDRKRILTGGVVVVGGLLTIGSAYLLWRYWSPASPDRAYMGTDSKIFEPLVGAVTAALMLREPVRRFVTAHAAWLGPLGLAGLSAGVVLLGGAAGPRRVYFAGGALVFSLCCAVLIAAVSVQDPRRGLARLLGWGPIAYLGRISYGIYLWHWPLAVWILKGEGWSPRDAALALALTVLLAAASYHLMESPLRTGRFGRARPRRILPAAAAVLLVATSASVALGRTTVDTLVETRGQAASNVGVSPITRTTKLMVVGDSVPQRLLPALSEVGMRENVIVSSASRGGCSVIGAVTVTGDGSPLDPVCTQMPATQRDELAKTRPDVVLWWSRYELADRLGPGGAILRADQPAFWALQTAEIHEAVTRLTATGATLVIVSPDRVGHGIYAQCEPGSCEPFVTRLATDDASRNRLTAILSAEAAANPKVRMVAIEDVYCRDAASPCDDRLPVREDTSRPFADPKSDVARPDGSHFAPAAATKVATVLLGRVLAAADVARG